MSILNRLTAFLAALMTFFSLQALFIWPNHISFIAGANFLIILWLWLNFTRPHILSRAMHGLIPVGLLASGYFFVIFLQTPQYRHITSVVVALCLWLYLNILYIFFYRPNQYRPNSLELMSEYFNLVIGFFFFTGAFSLQVFLNYPRINLVVAAFIVTLLLIWQVFWVNKLSFDHSLVYGLIGATVLTEIFASLLFLPTGYFVNSLAMTACFYLYTNLCLAFLQKEFSPRNIFKYVLISSLSLILVLVTANWT
ncbi:hypothetical protein HY224_02575 [Candidatus Uhrbacteria bacterium]|nr:hypothetical protein [Candidatus Uhrbacteria bacterium]